jgi:hypothetical protein
VILRLAAAAALVLTSIACGGGDGEGNRTSVVRQAYPDGPPNTRVIRFASAPPRVMAACRRVANMMDAPFPCPRQLPRATRAPASGAPIPAAGVELVHQGAGETSGVSIEYGAPPFEGGPPPGVKVTPGKPWQIRPCCFFHSTIEVLRSRPEFQARSARIAGRKGFLSSALGPRFTMYNDHELFTFPSSGRWSLITVHWAGSASATRILLDHIVANVEAVEPTRR